MAEQGLLGLEIVTPTGVVLNANVTEFTAPSVDGDFGVLPGHRPLLAALRTGIVTYSEGGQDHRVAVGSGFVEVGHDQAVMLTDRFIPKKDIDVVRVRLDLKHADESLDAYEGEPGSPEQMELVDKQLWVVAQLELYGDPPPPAIKTFMFTSPMPVKYEDVPDAGPSIDDPTEG